MLFLTVLLGLAASARILWKRVEYENANRTVQVIVDIRTLLASAPAGTTTVEAVARLKEAGAVSAGFFEYNALKLAGDGVIDFRRRLPLPGTPEVPGHGAQPFGMEASFNEEWAHQRGTEYLEAYFGEGACQDGESYCAVPDPGEHLENLSLGLMPPPPGIEGTPRFFNTPYETPRSIELKISALSELGDSGIVIFDGESVLGFPGLIEETAIEMKKHDGWNFGMVELTPQDGSSRLARNLPGRVLPVHSISEDELSLMSRGAAIERYLRAVRDRGVRVLYVRPYSNLYGLGLKEIFETNIEYTANLVGALEKAGYKTGKAEPLGPFVISKPLRGICIAGAAALAGLLIAQFATLPSILSFAAAAAAFFAVVFLPADHVRLFTKIAALATACTVPPLAVARFFTPPWRRESVIEGISKTSARWLSATAITVAGGIFVAAMLSHRDFYLRLDVFSGVKLAFLLPLIILFFAYLRQTGIRLRDFLDSPVRYAEFAMVIAMMGAVAVYLLRSGNEGPALLGNFDSFFRHSLESWFTVRPRTKEFLIGHPALLLAGLFPASRGRYFPLVVLVFGVVGQVSVLNTFCHLHTPLEITWARVCVGLMLGFLVGTAVRIAALIFLPVFGYSFNSPEE